MRTSLKYSENIMFADDTSIVTSCVAPKVGLARIRHDMEKVYEWFKANKLMMNITKCNLLVFRPGTKKKTFCTNIKLGHEIIKECDYAKLLGITIDNKLKWDTHVKQLSSKLAYGLFKLGSVKTSLTIDLKKKMYYAFFHSHLQYGISVWGPMLNMKQKNKIRVLQNKAIRLIMKLKYNASTKSHYQKLLIPTFEQLCKIELCKISYRFMNNLLSKSISSYFEIPTHGYYTRNQGNPVIPANNTKIYSNSFVVRATSLWLNLDANVKGCRTLKSFKYHIKKYLLKG